MELCIGTRHYCQNSNKNVFSILNNICSKCNNLQCACIETDLQDISSVITCSQHLHTETSHQFCDFSVQEMGNAKVSIQNKVYSNVNNHSTIESNIHSNAEQSTSLNHMLPPYTCNSLSADSVHITKTCPCNVYPLKLHFYIAKLGYVGVYLFFLFLLQNIDCGYSLEPPRRGGSNVYPQSMFSAKIRKISKSFH